MADYYELLGVSKSATEDEIKKAYRRLARELHPDINGGNPKSEERFKEVTAAYETLRDPEKRRQYDVYGEAGARGGGNGDFFAPNFGDIFENIFGQAFGGGGGGFRTSNGRPVRQGEDMEVRVQLSFEESVFGAQKEISVRVPVACSTCGGNGAKPGTVPSLCQVCGGAGQVRKVSQTLLGRMMTTAPCDRCHGEGQIITTPCQDCRGEGRRTEERKYRIDIQPGVDDGSILRLPGRGPAGPRGGYPGNLFVHISVKSSDRFERVGQDLRVVQPISFAQAALGTTISFETLEDTVDIAVAPATQSGKLVRIRNRGVPSLSGRGRGDLIVELVVETPKELSEEEVTILVRLAEIRGEKITEPGEHGIFSKLKSAFR